MRVPGSWLRRFSFGWVSIFIQGFQSGFGTEGLRTIRSFAAGASLSYLALIPVVGFSPPHLEASGQAWCVLSRLHFVVFIV